MRSYSIYNQCRGFSFTITVQDGDVDLDEATRSMFNFDIESVVNSMIREELSPTSVTCSDETIIEVQEEE